MPMVSRRQSSGIWITVSGGRRSFRGEYQNYYAKMYGNRSEEKKAMKVFVTGVGGQLGYDVMNELHQRGNREYRQ